MHAQHDWPRKLRKAMTRAGFTTAADLASAAGLSYSVVYRWLEEDRVPNIDNLRAISGPLEVPLLELIVWTGLLSADEARIDTSAQITPEEALRTDPTLTDEGRRAGLATLEGLRKAFSSTPDAGRRKRSGA